MDNKEIKVKSYQYLLQNLLILFTVVSAIIAIVLVFNHVHVAPVIVFGALAALFFIGLLFTRFGCRTYDIYTESGIKRVRDNRIIFDIKWNNVKSTLYYGAAEIIILSPFVLNINLIDPMIANENRSYDDKECFSTPMSRKTLNKIEVLMPNGIKPKK